MSIPEVAAQGGTWGPMLCSNTIDTVGKFSRASGQFYLYKNIARDIPLAMVDGLLSVRTCGFQSIETNVTINTMIEIKKKYSTIDQRRIKKSKCHFMHLDKRSVCCPGMKVHGVKADRVTEAVYLGDTIRDDGKMIQISKLS